MSRLAETFPITISVPADDAGKRLDAFLATRMESTSRARVQQLIAEEKILVNGAAAKASLKLRGGETITILGQAERPPLRAVAEDIPLDIVYEDADLAVINKAAGMMVHAGAGATEDARNRGTLVNALLHHFAKLSGVGGELRPGIVHRLDRETSGLIIVAKNDAAHSKLGAAFAAREVRKNYVALVHGWVKKDSGTISQSIRRDPVHRTKMTTRGEGGRTAVSHYKVARRIDSRFGKFTLIEVKIDTGRTHQIRVHMAAMGHPVVGDTTYGALKELRVQELRVKDLRVQEFRVKELRPGEVSPEMGKKSNSPLSPKSRDKAGAPRLNRNFLHSAELEFHHPRTGMVVSLKTELPWELREFLQAIESGNAL